MNNERFNLDSHLFLERRLAFALPEAKREGDEVAGGGMPIEEDISDTIDRASNVIDEAVSAIVDDASAEGTGGENGSVPAHHKITGQYYRGIGDRAHAKDVQPAHSNSVRTRINDLLRRMKSTRDHFGSVINELEDIVGLDDDQFDMNPENINYDNGLRELISAKITKKHERKVQSALSLGQPMPPKDEVFFTDLNFPDPKSMSPEDIKFSESLLKKHLTVAKYFASKSGPDPDNHDDQLKLMGFTQDLNNDIHGKRITEAQYIEIMSNLGKEYFESIFKRCLMREGGRGCFLRMNEIYDFPELPSNHPAKLNNWNIFYSHLDAAIAVYERTLQATEDSTRVVAETLNKGEVAVVKDSPCGSSKYSLDIVKNLSVEGGPLNPNSPKGELKIILRDIDETALVFAKNSISSFVNNNGIKNITIDVLQTDLSKPNGDPEANTEIDAFYCGGLIDYFPNNEDYNAIIASMLFGVFDKLKKGGIAHVGQFKKGHPTQDVMETLGNWYLYLRDEADMNKIIKNSNIPLDQIELTSTRDSILTQWLIRISKK